jgi:hypothetical protein
MNTMINTTWCARAPQLHPSHTAAGAALNPWRHKEQSVGRRARGGSPLAGWPAHLPLPPLPQPELGQQDHGDGSDHMHDGDEEDPQVDLHHERHHIPATGFLDAQEGTRVLGADQVRQAVAHKLTEYHRAA